LRKRGYVPENPITKVSCPKTTKKLLPVVAKKQLDTLMPDAKNERDKALLQLLSRSGMRLSEAMKVRSSDFDWEGGTVTVLGKGSKYRKCLFGREYITAWFQAHDSLDIGIEGIKTLLRRLGSECRMKCSPHAFRRGFCTDLLRSGLSTRVAQSLGGWEDLEMVERYSKSLSFEDALEIYRGNNHS
jgi:site-specific recombinase XerD